MVKYGRIEPKFLPSIRSPLHLLSSFFASS
jgi:hypothetical protein